MKKKRPNNKRFSHIGSALDDTLRPFRARFQDSSLDDIWAKWETAVGKDIARNAKPGVYRDQILVVFVTSSPWLQHLQFLKADILTRLNRAIGSDRVKDIRFRIGQT